MGQRYDRLETYLIAGLVLAAAVGAVAWMADVRWLVSLSVLGIVGAIAVALAEIRRRQRGDADATRAFIGNSVRESTAAMQLVKELDVRAPLPAMGDWALPASSLIELVHLIRRHRPALVVELGSGGSTVVLGHAVKAHGGRVVSLDHDEVFAEATRQQLRAHGLEATCVVHTAPLTDVEIDGSTMRWYDPSPLAGLTDVGLVLVDGPPETTGPLARFPALPVLRDQLAPGAFVVLDDADRAGEQRILELWAQRWPELVHVPAVAPRTAFRRL